MKKRVFSGIQPSGQLHIGNYLGAIRNWRTRLDSRDNIFCVVDQHAITVPYDPEDLRQGTREAVALYIACGLDPQKCRLFVQSHIPEHTELAWLLTCITPMGLAGADDPVQGSGGCAARARRHRAVRLSRR